MMENTNDSLPDYNPWPAWKQERIRRRLADYDSLRSERDSLLETLTLAHGCLREVHRDFDRQINDVIDNATAALLETSKGGPPPSDEEYI